MRVLVLGISGMLGSMLFRFLGRQSDLECTGTVRDDGKLDRLTAGGSNRVISNVDAFSTDSVARALESSKAQVVINCIGMIKQRAESADHASTIQLNALFPHQLAHMSDNVGARLIHVSTDCVFSGRQGGYTEDDEPDATDLYGRSKCLGEVTYGGHLTLRTSIIGHELGTKLSLVDWFLSQGHRTTGYRKAIFSGLPTIEIASIIAKHVIPNRSLKGLYHVSAEPIAKSELLRLIAEEYKKSIAIDIADTPVIDRSLDSTRFGEATGYRAPSWPDLISRMHESRSALNDH